MLIEVISALVVILVALLVITVFIGIEYFRFPDKGLQGASQQLKGDIISIMRGFIETPKIRHVFDITLPAEIQNIVEPYSAIGMDIDVACCYEENGLPYICVEYIPQNTQTAEDLATLTEYIKIKVRRYLVSRNLYWRIFSLYTQSANIAQIRVYYAEFPEDLPLLRYKYRQVIKEKCAADYGYIRDEELDKELKNVDKRRI